MSDKDFARMLGVAALLLLLAIAGLMWGVPRYGLYRAEMRGRAALLEAENSKRVAIEEAKAKAEAARALAEAEVERAKGVAEANRIIGESLQGNDAYLRYLWIQGLQDSNGETVYIPTEAGLPILEAGRFGRPAEAVK